MPRTSLEQEIQQAGDPVTMLRSSPASTYAIPGTPEYTNWRDEQVAWRETAVVFDQSSHMTDVYFRGPDVGRLLSDLGVNSIATFGRDRAKHFVACTEAGHVIGDAVLFGLEDDEVSLVGRPAVPNWVAFHAETGGYDVEVRRDERTVANPAGRLVFRYQLQGPMALRILEQARGGPIERIPFFRIGEFTLAGCPIRALNHTMSGVPGLETTGLEMTGPAEHGPAVMAALLAAGDEFGLRRGGVLAYPTTSFESGWIASPMPAIYSGEHMTAYREWLPGDGWEATASLGGSFTSGDIEDYYSTPWDLGYGGLVRFDHDFLGRSALEQLADRPHRRKVWLHWDPDDVARVIRSSLFDPPGTRPKYLDIPKSVYATLPFDAVLSGDRLVGLSLYAGYTANIGGWVSLAMVDEADAVDGAEAVVVWGEEDGGAARPTVEPHVQTTIRARIGTRPPV
ncbi:aminomethyl transferase family protein [Geodermatophilus sabuli]|uniref:Aminomethyl transferase family protein n=1 Tax=Geodermatophilus sabuli TaxID=1564158 RepID=A0A7K3VVA1_9ACTN|nr:aminomethyl transferase family protein [Geodermatophilus sabuli]NEK56522.1 aminomethyl transferase family protein [Geodermatophilus sabuli]